MMQTALTPNKGLSDSSYVSMGMKIEVPNFEIITSTNSDKYRSISGVKDLVFEWKNEGNQHTKTKHYSEIDRHVTSALLRNNLFHYYDRIGIIFKETKLKEIGTRTEYTTIIEICVRA